MGRAGACARQALKAKPARLSFYARNRFELWHILPPQWNFLRFCRPNGRLFLDFGGAKARCFLGGNEEIARRLRRHLFCRRHSRHVPHRYSWYNRLAHKSSEQVVFIGSNGYFVQIRLVLVCVQRSSLLSARKVVS